MSPERGDSTRAMVAEDGAVSRTATASNTACDPPRDDETSSPLGDDVLDFSKLEAGAVLLRREPMCLADAVEGAICAVARKAAEKGLDLGYTMERGVPRVKGDSLRIRQLLVNLLLNAVKFTDWGGIRVDIGLAGLEGDSALVKLSVCDSGVGVPPSMIPTLLLPFRQHDVAPGEHGRVGLGLAIVRRLASLMHGEVGVESVEGAGSAFWATLLLEREMGPGPAAHDRGLRDLRALVVADGETNRSVLAGHLERLALRTISAATRDEAFDLLDGARARDPFDLVLLGGRVPSVDGVDLARRIKASAEHRATRVVVLVGPGAATPVTASVDAWLSIPVLRGALADTLAALFHRGPAESDAI